MTSGKMVARNRVEKSGAIRPFKLGHPVYFRVKKHQSKQSESDHVTSLNQANRY